MKMTEVCSRRLSASKMAFISLLFIVFSLSACRAQVPLVLWSSEGYSLPNLPEPTAGEIVSEGKLLSYLKSVLTTSPHNVVLFLQEKLSTDDFTVYGGIYDNKQDGVFVNLKSALQESASLVLSSLAWSAALSVPELFQTELGVSALHVVPSELSKDQLKASEPSILIVSLPYNTGEKTKELLRKNDDTIGEVLTFLRSQGVPYTAVYTGQSPSHVTQDMSMAEGPMRRSLLQAPLQASVKPPVSFNATTSNSTLGPCILLWADLLNISYDGGNWFDLGLLTFNDTVNLSDSSCNETEARLVLSYQNVLNFQSFQLIFVMRKIFFPVSARNWTVMEQVVLNYNTQTAVFNASLGIYAPAEYSFHCQSVSSMQSPLLVPRNAEDNATRWRVLFTDFQIQGFGVTGESFSYASDCAGFFSAGIWMGLLTSLLMLLILTYGLHMLLQVRTMDRFDDPKGPAISVPLTD